MPSDDISGLLEAYTSARAEQSTLWSSPDERRRADATSLEELARIRRIALGPFVTRGRRASLRLQATQAAGRATWTDSAITEEILRINSAITRRGEPSLLEVMHRAYLADHARVDVLHPRVAAALPAQEQPRLAGLTKSELMDELTEAARTGRQESREQEHGPAIDVLAALEEPREEAGHLAADTLSLSEPEAHVAALKRAVYLRARWEEFDALDIPSYLNEVDRHLVGVETPYALPTSDLPEKFLPNAPAITEAATLDPGETLRTLYSDLSLGITGSDPAAVAERLARARAIVEEGDEPWLYDDALPTLNSGGNLDEAVKQDPLVRQVADREFGALSEVWIEEQLEVMRSREIVQEALVGLSDAPLGPGTAPATPAPVAADVVEHVATSESSAQLRPPVEPRPASPFELREMRDVNAQIHAEATLQGQAENDRLRAGLEDGSMTVRDLARLADADREHIRAITYDNGDGFAPMDIAELAGRISATWDGVDDELAGTAFKLFRREKLSMDAPSAGPAADSSPYRGAASSLTHSPSERALSSMRSVGKPFTPAATPELRRTPASVGPEVSF